MPVNVGTLVIDLVAGTASFSQSMDKMSALSAKTANDVSRSLMKISVAGVAAVTTITGALTAMIKGSLDSVDALDKAAQSAGTTAETLSTLQYAASLSNVEAESLTMALEKLSKAELAAATGNVELERAFKKMGVTASDGNGHLKDSGVLYEQLAQKFAAMPDGAIKTALAIQLFGKAGAQQIPLLNQLGADLAGVQREAQQFGLVVGTDVAELAAKAHDNLDRLHQVLKGIGYSVLSAVLPAMDELLEKLIAIAKEADIPALAKSFGKEVSDAVVKLGEAMAFAAKHTTALKVALEALAAVQISRILLPLAADLAAGGWKKVAEGVGKFATSLFGLQKAVPAAVKLTTGLMDTIKLTRLLAESEGVAAAAGYALRAALAAIGGPVTIVVGALAAIGVALYSLRDHFITLQGEVYKFSDLYTALFKTLAGGHVLDFAYEFSAQLVKAQAARKAAEKALTTTQDTTKKKNETEQPTVAGLGKPEKDPYKETIDKLQLAIDTQNAYIGVLNGTPDAIAAVTAAEKAEAIILEVNNKLKEKGKSLTADQEAEIRRRVALEESAKAIAEAGKSLVTQTQQSALAAKAADNLAAAQLRGVDAARAASVENEINAAKANLTTAQLKTLGPILDGLGAQLLTTMNTTAVDNLSTSIDQQLKQLNLETQQAQIMADAWGKGDAAIEAARIRVELLGKQLNMGAGELALFAKRTGELTAGTQARDYEQQIEQSKQRTDALQDEADKQKIVTDAILGTLDARRQAEIAEKTFDVDKRIREATDEKVRATLKAERDQIIANTQAQQAQKTLQDALALRSPVELYREEKQYLDEATEALKKHNGGMLTYSEALGIAAKQQELLNKASDDEITKLLKMGGLTAGVKAFFLEMQKSAISAAQIIFDALNSAFDKLSDNLANLMTGQKANWAAMLKDIGHQMAQQSIQAMLQKGLGAIGKALGINLQRMDGQSADTALWVQLKSGGPGAAGGGGLLGIPGLKLPGGGSEPLSGDYGIPDAGALTGTFAKLGGFIGKLAGAFGGAFAGGGEVEPGSAYLVGERGPELYTPGAAGNIHSNDETGRMLTTGGGAMHYYNIDARGTDPVLTEQRTRAAIIAAHQSAIMTSTQVQTEKTARMPPHVRR